MNSNTKKYHKKNSSNVNVFKLNNILEDKSQFCYEIKLGHSKRGNVNALKKKFNNGIIRIKQRKYKRNK